jgi:hypothetical protein
VEQSHRDHVRELLREAADEHAELIARLPREIGRSLPVDAQGVTRAIDYLAEAAGLSEAERQALIRPHALNPAVLHARIFGPAPLARETVIGSFVEGARVRAEALGALADAAGGAALGQMVRSLLVEHPPPVSADSQDVVTALEATYAAQEEAAVAIAAGLDAGLAREDDPELGG